jgi:hypothetical protein
MAARLPTLADLGRTTRHLASVAKFTTQVTFVPKA